MAEANGNGKMEVRVGDKSIGVSGKEAAMLLFILMIGALGYFVGTQVTTNQQHGLNALATMVEKMASHQATLVELVHTNREQLQDSLQAQNALLGQQTTMLISKVDEHSGAMEAKFAAIARQLSVLNYNMHKEEGEQLPLDVTLPPSR